MNSVAARTPFAFINGDWRIMISRDSGSHGGPRNSVSFVRATSDSAKLLVQFDSPAPDTAARNRSLYRVMSQLVMIPPYEWPVVPTRSRSTAWFAIRKSTPDITSSPSFVPHDPHVAHLNASP